MSNQYLDRFRSSLPTTQGKQILKLLISKRDSGEIKTLDEFKNKLKELTSELLAERITPTFKLWRAVGGEDISSEQYNDMLERIENDLEAAFTEADNIDEVIEIHHNIINRVALKALRFGVNELESRINLYEFLNKNRQGFDDAQFNTFRESQDLTTSRSDSAASLVFIDPRHLTTILSSEDAHIDPVGERLLLGPDSIRYLTTREATWLANENSVRSELDVEFPNSSISNIIDNRQNTYWVVPVLTSDIRPTGVPLEVALSLFASQDINFIEIEPASNFPMTLVGIDYVDSNGTRRTILSTEVNLRGPTRINFGRITTKDLIVRVKQNNYREIQFKQKLGQSNFHKAVLNQSDLPIDLDSINEDLQEVLTSDFILNDVIGLTNTTQPNRKFFEYILGFDNIKVGFNTFDERSVFVSKKKTVEQPGQVALRTLETRPIQVEGSTSILLEEYSYPSRTTDEDQKFHHGCIEYWLILQLFGEDDFLISTDVVPVLPLGAQRIYHEQLIFTDKSDSSIINPDMGSLMFYAEDDSSDVSVYRNGTLLTYSTDWDFVSSAHSSGLTLEIPNAGSRMKRGIQILDDVRLLDIYTVSYTPTTSNTRTIPTDTTLFNMVDLIGDQSIRMTSDNTVVFENVRLAHTIVRAEMYLNIIMRRNSANLNFSPALEEYMLVTGSRNQQKFIGDS